MNYRIKGGTLVLPEGTAKKDLLISNGRIADIIDRSSAADGYAEINASGLFVSSGFVDIHQHGGGGADYMDADKDTYYRATTAHLSHGTTSLMPTLLSADTALSERAIRGYLDAKRDPRIKSNLLGIHMEGRYISPSQAGAQKREHIVPFNENEYRALYELSEGSIKRWSVAPEIEGAEAFARFAGEKGITLSIAHSDADLDTVKKAFDMGFRHVTHLYSCISTITRRKGFRVPGILEAAYLIDEMNVEIIADGCHLPHSLLSFVTKFKKNERIALITDAMRAAGEDTKTSFLGSADDPLPVIIEDGVAKLCDRSAFGGSIATADRLIRNMLMSGSSLSDAVSMVTVNPIKMMGLDLRKGLLKKGYDADICIFDEDINVKRVLVGGEIVI